VGQALLEQFRISGIRVAAVVRGAHVQIEDAGTHDVVDAAAAPQRAFDVVVNLAYPTSGPAFAFREADAAIRQLVLGLAREGGRIVHASSLAVFGLQLEREPRLGPAPDARDHPYVESKLGMERELCSAAERRGLALDIVRLGNVWGPGSGAWTVPIVHRLMAGRPVGVTGLSSPSNTTEVRNAASYLAHLAVRSFDEARRYHHLAEFSAITWTEWMERLSESLGWPAVRLDTRPSAARGAGPEIRAALDPIRPRALYRRLMHEDIMGSRLRTAVRAIPASARRRLRGRPVVFASEPPLAPDERVLMRVLSVEREFRTDVDPAWAPMVTSEQSLADIVAWVGAL
jgi:nucleoside-diphosphate-sugar epimerase